MKRAIAVALFCASAGIASAQTINPDFGGCYALRHLGQVPGVPANYGGITFKFDDPDVLLIGGEANTENAAIYAVRVTRDAEGAIDGFDGDAVIFASAPQIDGGLAYGPDNVLFFSGFPTNTIGQIKAGSTSPDKTTNLDSALQPSMGALQFVPDGFPGAGRLKTASYSYSEWADIPFAPDGSGTFNFGPTANSLIPLSDGVIFSNGPEGIVYVQPGNPGITKYSVLISEFGSGTVSCYEVDSIGDPIFSTRRELVQGLFGTEGGTRDPRTGHFLFSTYGGGHEVVVVTGFNTSCRPNLNGDCYTDDADFVLFAPMYNILDCADPAMPVGCPADLNDDGFVDDADFVIFVDAYNRLICV
ncbi:MAG: hypothetical protein KF805_17170 [Phycisphaeraceae bacterium]|nr:hypothetical protein [Phycisphaeraceae bacterium]